MHKDMKTKLFAGALTLASSVIIAFATYKAADDETKEAVKEKIRRVKK